MSSKALCCLTFWFLTVSVLGLKTWIPNTSLNNKNNWKNQDVPRNCDHLTFNVDSDISLLWSNKDLIVSGMDLPFTGSIFFLDQLTVDFKDRKDCPEARDMTYERNKWKDWVDPYNWDYESDGMWLPHTERLPCFDEDIKFPPGGTFAVNLPIIMVPVGKIYFNDEIYDGDEWADYLNSEDGRRQFQSTTAVQSPWLHDMGCSAARKCSCGTSSYVFESRIYNFVDKSLLDEFICSHARASCKSADCHSPVTPHGHCCGVCGAVMVVSDNTHDDGLLNDIRQRVKDMRNGYSDDVKYHVGRTEGDDIQITILSESLDETSNALELASVIRDRLKGENFNILAYKASGLSLFGYLFNSTSGVVFGTLFAVLLFFASIYFIYIVLPEKRFVSLSDEHPFRFIRFRNVLHEGGSEEKLEFGTEATDNNDSEGFHNPTFSGKTEPTVTALKTEPEETETEEVEQGTVREYDNPTYHEMEKTKDIGFFDVKSETVDNEEEQRFSEVEL